VERALLTVPRHRFLPGHSLVEAYDNVAITTSWERGAPVSSVSQPEIIAVMLQQLRVQPGMRVLEVGAGSGYNAALLAELAGPTGSVVSLEIDETLAAEAMTRLSAAGYAPERARVIAGDGWRGWPDGAPFDRIELTVGAMDLSPAWFAQLTEGGLLVAPLWLGATDVSVALRKQGDALVSESWTLCGFVRLRGEGAADQATVARLSDRLTLTGPNAQALAAPINALLATRARRLWWGQHNSSVIQYLALASGRMLSLWQANGRRGRRLRGRYLLYMEGSDGPSMVIFPNRAPALLAFGGMAAERYAREQSEAYRQRGAPPVERWGLVARPRASGAPPPAPPAPGVARMLTAHWVYDIRVGE
jgi:protein-L-isoaspartate(D-aspartate) O-methyltransferase